MFNHSAVCCAVQGCRKTDLLFLHPSTCRMWLIYSLFTDYFKHAETVNKRKYVCVCVARKYMMTFKVLLPTDAQNNCFKRILKFTLKQLQRVSVLSQSSWSVQFEFAKVMFVKTVH